MNAPGALPVELQPEAAMASYGKTFHWASRTLGPELAGDARSFYALCRYADDLADEAPAAEAMVRLEDLQRDLLVRSSDRPVVADFLAVAHRRGVDLEPVRTLVGAVADDLRPARFDTVSELLNYAYRVAGTVGLVMCDLFGVREAEARLFAVDLGIAMQLTNVARDVLEDAGRGRRYIPAELLGRSVAPRDLCVADVEARELALTAVERVLSLADVYYRSADRGMHYLPLRPRGAVLIASRCYEAIGTRILRLGVRYWQSRVHVGRAGKLWHTARALGSLSFDRGYSTPADPEPHDPKLHRALRGLADGGQPG